MSSELKTNKISPATGTTTTLGDASDVFQLPASGEIDVASGATLDVNGTLDVTGATVTGLTTGSFVKITTQTINSEVSALTFTDVFSSTYESYLIVVAGLATSNNGMAIRMYLGTSDLSTTRTIGWQMSEHEYNSRYSRGSASADYYVFVNDTDNSIISGPACGQIWVHKPTDSVTATKMTSHFESYCNGSGNTYAYQVAGGQVTSATEDVSFKFVSQTANLGDTGMTGRVTVFGVAH